jgi:hypothetical protein
MLPFSEVPIELVVRGRDHRAPTVSLDEVSEESLDEQDQLDADERKAKTSERKAKAAGAAKAPRLKPAPGHRKPAGKRTLQKGPPTKPKPKKAAPRGARRGTRPR